LSVRRPCELLGLNRSSLYYEAATETGENLRLMQLLDQEYTAHPFLGSRRLTEWLVKQEAVNRKRVQRLMRVMGLEAIYPKPKLSLPGQGHKIFPYLLRGVTIGRVDQVWSTDITYVSLAQGFMYVKRTPGTTEQGTECSGQKEGRYTNYSCRPTWRTDDKQALASPLVSYSPGPGRCPDRVFSWSH
jgi:hypothetical protein